MMPLSSAELLREAVTDVCTDVPTAGAVLRGMSEGGGTGEEGLRHSSLFPSGYGAGEMRYHNQRSELYTVTDLN